MSWREAIGSEFLKNLEATGTWSQRVQNDPSTLEMPGWAGLDQGRLSLGDELCVLEKAEPERWHYKPMEP